MTRSTMVFTYFATDSSRRYFFGPGGISARMTLSMSPEEHEALGEPKEITVAIVPGARVGDVSLGISKVTDHG